MIVLFAMALLWLIVCQELSIVWSANPQYSFGWIVPLLVAGLLVRRFDGCRGGFSTTHETIAGKPHAVAPAWILFGVFALAAFLVFPLRLILEANPGWRTLHWILAGCAVAITLVAVYWMGGRYWLRHLAFPISFILVAVAWPPSIESPVLDTLTRLNARAVVEVMSILGVPTIQHANVIEVSNGIVGIDEACSGIRSFQSSIMIALFVGEFYRFSVARRIALIPIGMMLAVALNVSRTSLLTYVAANQSIEAISKYHDPAGLTILAACTLGMWGVGLAMSRQSQNKVGNFGGANNQAKIGEDGVGIVDMTRRGRSLRWIGIALLLWLIGQEVAVEAWYRAHENRSATTVDWALAWPPDEPGFKEGKLPESVHAILKYDEGKYGVWPAENGGEWFLYYFRWKPGRIAAYSAASHSPNECLRAAGKELHDIGNNRSPITIGPIVFPFRRYQLEEDGELVHVFHCLWEEQAPSQFFAHDPNASTMALRLNAVRQGRRNLGQRSIEIILTGGRDAEEGRAAIEAQLRKLIRIES